MRSNENLGKMVKSAKSKFKNKDGKSLNSRLFYFSPESPLSQVPSKKAVSSFLRLGRFIFIVFNDLLVDFKELRPIRLGQGQPGMSNSEAGTPEKPLKPDNLTLVHNSKEQPIQKLIMGLFRGMFKVNFPALLVTL